MIYNLKVYRLANKLTQLGMGKILGLSKSYISMIETGKRPMPDDANNILIRLQQTTDEASGQHLQVVQENFFHDLISEHRITSGDYIAMHCGDLKSEMHRLNKLIKAWTVKFNDAGRVLTKVQHMLYVMRKAGSLSAYTYDGFMLEKMAAENELREVLKQKPELAIIRIEGIKKELDAAKKLLGKQNRFPVLDEVTDYYKFNNKPAELPPPAVGNLLPPGANEEVL